MGVTEVATAKEIIEARQATALGEALHAAMVKRGMKSSEIARAVYGEDSKGFASGTGKMGEIVRGRNRPSDPTLPKFADALGLEIEPLIAMRDAMPRYHNVAARKNEKPQAKALPAPPLPAPSRADEPPQFSLVIDQAGQATLRLNLVGVPMRTALQAMGALTAAGLLDGDGA